MGKLDKKVEGIMGTKMYVDYLRDTQARGRHKHTMPPEAHPPQQTGGPQVLSGGVLFKNSPKREAKMLEQAEKRANLPANYIRKEIVRQIQEDLRIA